MKKLRIVNVLLATGLLGIVGCDRGPTTSPAAATPAQDLTVGLARGALPTDDPTSPDWNRAREVIVELLPQDVMEPRTSVFGAQRVRLRALHDGRQIAFRLEWEDGEPDHLVNMDRSADAVALQFPATGEGGPLPDAMMGEAGRPVEISQWRYALQTRLEGQAHGVAALYPHATNDHYPYEGARDPGIRALMEKRYAPARAAGNPIAASKITSAVQDLQAEGFGTLNFQVQQRSQGKGVHRSGKWFVVIHRPLDLEPTARTQLRPGARTHIAVAVWNGGKGHTGAKKMRSIWVPVTVEGPQA